VKRFFLAGILLLSSSVSSAQNQQIIPPDYPTLYLSQWAYNCTMALMSSVPQDIPPDFAFRLALGRCSCVIDHFRSRFKQSEVMGLTLRQREEIGERYAAQCIQEEFYQNSM